MLLEGLPRRLHDQLAAHLHLDTLKRIELLKVFFSRFQAQKNISAHKKISQGSLKFSKFHRVPVFKFFHFFRKVFYFFIFLKLELVSKLAILLRLSAAYGFFLGM